VYLHYPSQRCRYLLKNPITILTATGFFVGGSELLLKNRSGPVKGLRWVSAGVFIYNFLKTPFEKTWNQSWWSRL
jgi:hypothetical protein